MQGKILPLLSFPTNERGEFQQKLPRQIHFFCSFFPWLIQEPLSLVLQHKLHDATDPVHPYPQALHPLQLGAWDELRTHFCSNNIQ